MSTTSANTSARTVRLDDLIALHREIAAMARAGIPLELGLRSFAGGIPNRLGQLADRVADRLSEGASLADAIEAEGLKDSSVYSAVISAGIRSGRLAEAMESLAESSEQIQESRRYFTLALINPVTVCVLAVVLASFFLTLILPRYIQSAEDFGFGNDVAFQWLRWLQAAGSVVVWVVPLLFGLALLSIVTPFRAGGNVFGQLDGHRWLNQSQFAQILKLQIEHGLPLGESFIRAANSTTDPALRVAAQLVAEEVNRGASFSDAISVATALPPMMRWMLASGERQKSLVKSLQLMCDSYRRRALNRARALRVWFPVLMTVFVSGTIAFLYGLLFFGVLNAFWQGIIRE